MFTQVVDETSPPEMQQTEMTGTKDKVTLAVVPQQPHIGKEDKAATQATKKAKYD